MSQVLDYSLARPSPAAIAAAGYVGVVRYVAPVGKPSGNAFGGADDSAKVIFAPEYAALHAAGLQIALNWEWYADRAREGAASGTADAQEALRQAAALGYTGAIYFSVDYDAPPADQPAINAYFQACAQVLSLQRLGAYAGYWPLSRLFNAGLISYGWQTIAWSGGNRESRAHLYQTAATVFNNGADVNDILKENWTGETMIPKGPTQNYTVGPEIPSGTTFTQVASTYGLDWTADLLPLNSWAQGYDPALAIADGTQVTLPGYPRKVTPATAKLVIDADSIRAVIG